MILDDYRNNPESINKFSGYHSFRHWENNNSYTKYGSFEVFYVSAEDIQDVDSIFYSWLEQDRFLEITDLIGWYWVACFPGCLWDSEPSSPFKSSGLAYLDAIEL